jgi:hypothetical protein
MTDSKAIERMWYHGYVYDSNTGLFHKPYDVTVFTMDQAKQWFS